MNYEFWKPLLILNSENSILKEKKSSKFNQITNLKKVNLI